MPLYDASGDHGVCYASRANSFVIRADGRVNKCTISLESPKNQVGRLEPDGGLTLDVGLMLPWMRGLFPGDSKELQCPLIGLADEQLRRSENGILDPDRLPALA